MQQLIPKTSLHHSSGNSSKARAPRSRPCSPHRVCTDIVFSGLYKCSRAFRDVVDAYGATGAELDFHTQGCASIGDLELLLLSCQGSGEELLSDSSFGSDVRISSALHFQGLFKLVHAPTDSDRVAASRTANRSLQVILFCVGKCGRGANMWQLTPLIYFFLCILS